MVYSSCDTSGRLPAYLSSGTIQRDHERAAAAITDQNEMVFSKDGGTATAVDRRIRDVCISPQQGPVVGIQAGRSMCAEVDEQSAAIQDWCGTGMTILAVYGGNVLEQTNFFGPDHASIGSRESQASQAKAAVLLHCRGEPDRVTGNHRGRPSEAGDI